MLPFFHEDIEYRPVEEGGAVHGHDALRKKFRAHRRLRFQWHRDEGSGTWQRSGDDPAVLAGLALPRGQGLPLGGVPRPDRGPRSRGADGSRRCRRRNVELTHRVLRCRSAPGDRSRASRRFTTLTLRARARQGGVVFGTSYHGPRRRTKFSGTERRYPLQRGVVEEYATSEIWSSESCALSRPRCGKRGCRSSKTVWQVGEWRDPELVWWRELRRARSKPSKPWGCGSRRCRRRTSSSCGWLTRPSAGGDLEALAEVTDSNWVFDFSRSIGPDEGIYRGREQVLRFAGLYGEAFERFQLSPIECIVGPGGEIVVRHQVSAKGRGSGVEWERVPDAAYGLGTP